MPGLMLVSPTLADARKIEEYRAEFSFGWVQVTDNSDRIPGLEKAKELGLKKVRLICLDTNAGSQKTILANGGIYLDTLHGEESGLNVLRYDMLL